MTARRGLALAGAAVALLLVAGRVLAGAYVNWAWYGALGAGALWSVRLAALTALRGGLFIIAFGFAFANLLAMRRSIVTLVLPRRLGNLEIGEAVPGRALTAAAAMLGLLIAAAVALPQSDWMALVRAEWARPLGELDPYLNRDIAFWVGWLPFERLLHEWSVTLAVVVGVMVMLLYGLTPSVQVKRGQMHVSTWVRRHFALYSAVLLLLVAWGYRIDAFELLIHGSGARETFVAFDHLVLYPYLIALGICTGATALLVAWTGWMGHQRATIAALLLVLVAGPVGRVVLPLLDRRSVTDRERGTIDRPYEHTRTLFTRRAYGIDEIMRGVDADSVRLADDGIARGVSSWDPEALARAAATEPGVVPLRGGVAWRGGSGGALTASVAYGERAEARNLPLAMQDVDPSDADERGAPWPSSEPSTVVLPALVVGLGLPEGVLVSDTLGRIAGPVFSTGWRRWALAWGVRNFRLAVADADPLHAKLLLHRDVLDRVHMLLPFFTTGSTPQAMVVHDSLWWSVELFHASDDYPLTEPLLLGRESWRFVRGAAVAVVNAQSGRVQVVLPDRPDQMTRWWRDRLPALFVRRAAADADLVAALPPPVDRAVVQGRALARTGFRTDTLSARPLFQADDADADLLPGTPTPYLSAATGHPLAWGAPAVDGIDRVRGVFVAVGGARQRSAFVDVGDTLRWASILDRLQHVADSARISRSRAHPRRGRVQVVPVRSGLLVVQSFYDWPSDREPSLAGVVALRTGEQARVAGSLAAAFGQTTRSADADGRLRLRLARIYAQLQDALRAGDWTAFGRAMSELKRLSSQH